MNLWKLPGLGLITSLALAPSLNAQVPAAPAKNLWSFLLPTAEQKAKCMETLCKSPLGAMLKSASGPVSAMSGGLIGANCCSPDEDLAKMKAEGTQEGAGGTAAQVKKSEAEAKARREAVRYLGTVDCNYWPNAKAVLKTSLRNDPNECVRYEAALALLHGCCCNEETIDWLKDSTNGGKKFGPVECSMRVREAAGEALAHCTAIYKEMTAPDATAPEQKKENQKEKEALQARASTRGKGLVGILAAASMQNYSGMAPPGAQDPMTFSTTSYTPLPSVKSVAKQEPIQRVGFDDKNTSNPVDNLTKPAFPPAEQQPSFVPAMGSYPGTDMPALPTADKKTNSSETIILPKAALSARPRVLALPLLLPGSSPNANSAYTHPGASNNNTDAMETNRPAGGSVIPTRGLVILEDQRKQ